MLFMLTMYFDYQSRTVLYCPTEYYMSKHEQILYSVSATFKNCKILKVKLNMFHLSSIAHILQLQYEIKIKIMIFYISFFKLSLQNPTVNFILKTYLKSEMLHFKCSSVHGTSLENTHPIKCSSSKNVDILI